jgi:alpha-glucoside transport system substrate-binding protein
VTRRVGPLLVAAALALLGCGAPPVGDDVEPDAVDVFTPYLSTEADGFRAVLAAFTDETGIRTHHVGSADYAARMRQRVRDGDTPDVVLMPQTSLVVELAHDGQLVPLDDGVADVDTFLPGVADVGVVDDRRVGVAFRLAVKSLVWYPPTELREAGHTVPETWQELVALGDAIAADGVRPWCLGMEAFDSSGWVGTDWVEDLMLRMHGPQTYDAWATGDLAFTSPQVASAFQQFGRIALTDRLIFGGQRAVLATPALDALLPMLDEPPGCMLSRQASFQEAALPDDTVIGPDGDLDVFVLPGIEPGPAPLVTSGEIAAALDDRPDVMALIDFLAQPRAGEAWARLGGYTSPHATFAADVYATAFDRTVADLVAQTDLVRYDASDRMPPAVGTGSFWDGMVDYVSGVPLETVLFSIERGYGDQSAEDAGSAVAP